MAEEAPNNVEMWTIVDVNATPAKNGSGRIIKAIFK